MGVAVRLKQGMCAIVNCLKKFFNLNFLRALDAITLLNADEPWLYGCSRTNVQAHVHVFVVILSHISRTGL